MNKRRIALIILFGLLFIGLTTILWSSTELLSQRSSIGEQRLIVIPVYFPDMHPSTTVEQLEELVFQYADDYIRETSYEQAWLTGDVFNWTLASHPMDWYGGEDNVGVLRLVSEAISLTDPYVDFSGYDRLLIIHSGKGAQHSHNESLIRTCNIPYTFSTADLKKFNSASVVAEYDHSSPAIGTIVHELGHDFGAVDLYNETPNYPDLDVWALMASGNYNSNGEIPAGMCAYSKLLTGWIAECEVYTVRPGTHEITIINMANQESGFKVAKFDLGLGCYILVEARGSVGYDSALPGSGVLVTRIDQNKKPMYGRAELMKPPGCVIEQACWNVEQVFYDQTSGFGMSVLADTGNGFKVELSTLGSVSWKEHRMTTLGAGLEFVQGNNTVAVSDPIAGAVYAAFEILNTSSSLRHIEVHVSRDEGRAWEPYFSTAGEALNRSCPLLANIAGFPFLVCECERAVNHTIEAWNCTAQAYVNVTNPSLDDARNPVISQGEQGLYLAYQLYDSNLTLSVEYPIIAYRFMNETAHWFPPSFYSNSARAYMLSNQVKIPVGHSYTTYGPYLVFIANPVNQTSRIGIVSYGLSGPVTFVEQNVTVIEMYASVDSHGFITIAYSYRENQHSDELDIGCLRVKHTSSDWVEVGVPDTDEFKSLPSLLPLQNGSILLYYKAGDYLYELRILGNESVFQPSRVRSCSSDEYTLTRLMVSSLWSRPLIITSRAEALSYYYSTPLSPRNQHIYVPAPPTIGIPAISWAVPAALISLVGITHAYADRYGGIKPLSKKILSKITVTWLVVYTGALILAYSLSWLVNGALLFIVWVTGVGWMVLAAVSTYLLISPLWDDIKPRECPFCGELFHSPRRLVDHIEDEHIPE